MLTNEEIAHSLAVAWAQSAIEKKVTPKTQGKSMVEEYLAVYGEALDKLNSLNQTPH